MASDVLRAEMSCLTAESFENLIFLKGNMNIIDNYMMPLNIQEDKD